MNVIRRLTARVREFFASDSVDQDMADEIASHIDHLTDEYVRRGLNRDEARRRAVREFGGLDQVKEAVRDTRGLPMLEQLIIDIRRGTRALIKARGFTGVAVITLALGMGTNVATFSVLDAVVLRPLPYPGADRLVSIFEKNVGPLPDNATSSGSILGSGDDPGRLVVAPANLVDYQARAATMASMAGVAQIGGTITGGGQPARLTGEEVTRNYLDVLRVRPAIGRAFGEADMQPGAPAVVIISSGLWRSRFGGDPAIVGQTLQLDDTPRQIIGVMPPAFAGVTQFGAADIVTFWTPAYYPPGLLANRGDHEISVIGRLADGASIGSLQQSLTDISRDLATRFPDSNKNIAAVARPLRADVVRSVETSLVVIMTMVALILLIACANVANLMIIRGAGRRREVSIRYALGASRFRVMSEMLTESLILAGAACVVGLALAWAMKGTLVSMAPQSLPRLNDVALDARVLAFSVLLALTTGAIFGLLPAWQARTARPIDALRTGERTIASRWMLQWRNGLLIAELALSTILLVGAGLTIKSLASLNSVPLGFRTDHVLAMNVNLPPTRYKTGDARFAFFQNLEAQLVGIPGVRRVGFANRFPMRGGWISGCEIDGLTTGQFVDADFQAVSPGYFETLALKLAQGRLLTEADTNASESTAVVSQAFSTQFLGGRNAIGVRLRRGPKQPWITIVGVIADIRRDGKQADVTPEVYLSAAQTLLYPTRLADVAVLLDPNAGDVRNAVQQAVWAVDKDQPIANLRTLDEVVGLSTKNQRFQATLIGIFAVLALTLATIGIHGVVAYIVSQRTAEIGVRTALGADSRAILRWLLGSTAMQVAIGAALGLAGAIVLSRYLASLLFQVKPTDTVTYVVATLVLCGVAMGSAALAARRATTIDPVRALRGE